MNRDQENLKQLIQEFGFQEIESELLEHAHPSIRVATTRVTDEDTLPIGQSKIGGRPDLPPSVDWVQITKDNGEVTSLPFVAQLNLAELKMYDVEDVLPAQGMFYFFADPWRDQKEIDKGKMLFYDGDLSLLTRRDFPPDLLPTEPQTWGKDRYEPCSVTFSPEINLHDPSIGYDDLLDILDEEDDPELMFFEEFTMDESTKYSQLLRASSYVNQPFPSIVNRVLGVTHDIPHEMKRDCQLIMDTGTASRPSMEERAHAIAHREDWRLLFQLSSDENANMMWSDMGTICFFIRKQDLQARNFDHVIMTFM